MKTSKPNTKWLDELDTTAVDANKIEIIETTLAFREKLFQLVRNAQKRIYITALYLQDDEAGQQLLREIYLAKQSNPKLDVKIYVDYLRAQRGLMGHPQSVGNVRLYRELADEFEYPIDILGVPVKTKEVLGVLHLKGFVFDDTLLYSGASLNNIYLQQSERYRYDRYHVIQDKALTNSMVDFLRKNFTNENAVRNLTDKELPGKKQLKPMIKQFKLSLRASRYQLIGRQKKTEKNQVELTPLLGFGGRKNQLNNVIYELVKQTQKKLTIYTPYFNLPNKINKAVRRALKQGKQVDIIIGDKTANDFFIPVDQEFNRIGIVPYIYETNLRAFIKRNQRFVNSGLLNVHLWKHADNSFHLKGMSSDQQYYLITGHNINPRACRLDLENGVLIQDPSGLLKAQFEHEYLQILTHTKRVEHFNQIESIKDYPLAAAKLMRSVKRAKLDSILNRLL